MDALKAKRKSLRISFTTAANKMTEYLATPKTDAKDVDQLYALKSQLSDKFTRLNEIQNEISSLLLEKTETIAEYESDFETAENYRDNYLELESKVESFLNKVSRSVDKSSFEGNTVKLKLPKFELKTFSGDPKEYLTFWSIFSKIHESQDLSVIDKFQYLYQSMVPDSRAARLVSSFPITEENYDKAIQQLKLRFGREDLLVQIYVRDLLSLVMKNATVGKNSPDLATLYDMLETKLRALESLGRTKEKFADFLEPLVESCLPENILRAWERSRISENTDDSTSQRSLEKLMCFLRHEVESEEMISLAREGFGKDKGNDVMRKDYNKSVQKNEPTAATLIANASAGKNSCIFCDRAHPSQDCQKIAEMSYEDRKSQVMRKGSCLVCLKYGHMAKRCHSNVRCLICKRRHYALLCPSLRKGIDSSSKNRIAGDEKKSTEILLTNLPSEHEIYLKTITIRLRNRGKEVCARALLDDGSQRSYIEKSLAKELNLLASGREVFSQGLFGGEISPASEHKRYMVTVESLNRKYSTSLALLDQSKICSALPRINDRNLLAELASRGIKLTDVGRDTPPIRILLGADVLGSILTGRIEVLTSGVSAVETFLGWTILGLGRKRQVVNLVTLSLQNMELPKIWDLEILGITDPVERKNKILLEEETLTHFRKTLKVCEDQRYEVALPWLAGHPALYDKYDIAESRLRTATKRLLKENYFEAYDAAFKQWESEGIIETVPKDQITKPSHYLNATINYHLGLQKFQTEILKNTIASLREGFYVDNLVTSVNDVKELKQLKSQAIQIMKEGGFELRCWASNNFQEEQDTQMVLGIRWNIVNDELSCKLPSNFDRTADDKAITKRLLLSVINSIYDLIDFTAPALLLLKFLLQEAWREKLGWDDVLSPGLERKYRRWEKTTALLPKCTIPRRIFPEKYADVTLHIFTDLSSFAYATCSFLRCEYQGQVTVKLIATKARLAPMQKPTIPRLELLGAALGARFAATLHSVLPTPSKTIYWTDSMIVLCWIIKKEPWSTFVGNRVKEIRELTNIKDWKHVPGEINPADLATRYCDWSDLLQSQWWEVPDWLYGNEESWPISEISVQRIYPLELSFNDNLSEDHQETKTTSNPEPNDASAPGKAKKRSDSKPNDAYDPG